MEEWLQLYPDYEHEVYLNNKELDALYSMYRDPTPFSEEEKIESEKEKELSKIKK